MARGLKFRIKKVEGLDNLCSENKGADQLRSYREADLRLCFRICKKPVFSRGGSFLNTHVVRSFGSNVTASSKLHNFILIFLFPNLLVVIASGNDALRQTTNSPLSLGKF